MNEQTDGRMDGWTDGHKKDKQINIKGQRDRKRVKKDKKIIMIDVLRPLWCTW